MSLGDRYTDAHDLLTSAGFDLSPQEENYLKTATDAGSGPYALAVSSLYSSKVLQRSNEQLAESNDRHAQSNDKHANRMTWLTCALAFFAIVEAVATAVSAYSALVVAGIIGP